QDRIQRPGVRVKARAGCRPRVRPHADHADKPGMLVRVVRLRNRLLLRRLRRRRGKRTRGRAATKWTCEVAFLTAQWWYRPAATTPEERDAVFSYQVRRRCPRRPAPICPPH